MATPMDYPAVKNAYLFSCFCGLRISDIIGLKWKNVYIDNGQYRLEVVMQKTKEPIYLPLSEESLKWMPDRGEKTAEDRVFDLSTPTYINVILKPWAKAAGIDKHFTFHCFRHTYATLQIASGTDIYTVSKMLTHKNVTTTQIYADLVNAKKRETVNRISLK